MNTLFQKIIAGLSLTLSLGLVACQKESLVSPELSAPISTETGNAVSDFLDPIEKYTLIEHGTSNFTYAGSKIDNVTAQYAVAGEVRYEYSSVRGTPKIKAIWGNSPYITHDVTYLIDSNGRCYESTYKAYSLPGHIYSTPVDTLPKTWRYLYNNQGQLASRWNKNNVNEWINYEYDSASDLRKITWYDATGVAIKAIALDYTASTGQLMPKNLYPLNLEVSDLPDRYQRIFGKSSTHLVSHITQKGSKVTPYSHIYTYTYNADGYVTGESKFYPGKTELFEYKIFVYKTKNATQQ